MTAQGLIQQLFPLLPPSSVKHYECGHVVPRESLIALVAGRGPSGLTLALRHQERGKEEVMDEVQGKDEFMDEVGGDAG